MNSKEKIQLHKGMDCVRKRDFEKAQEYFQNVVASNPDIPEAWNNLGVARRRQGKTRLAVEAFERALEADQSYAAAYKNLGVALEDLGDKERAARAYRAYVSYAPTAADVMQIQNRAKWLER